MVNLNFVSSSASNIITFGSSTSEGFIKINNDSTGYTLGTSNSYFYIKNLNDTNNNYALKYDNNIFNINNINLNSITNNNIYQYPNTSILLSAYTFTSSDNIVNHNPNNIFINSINYWTSASIYNNSDGKIITNQKNSTYNFNNLNNYGAWIQIKLPNKILLDSIDISNTSPANPKIICLYALNNYNNSWILLLNNYNITSQNIAIPQTNVLYDTFAIIIIAITLVITDQSVLSYPAIISSLKFNSKSPINFNNYIKICGPNIYDINSINTNQIILNNNSISNFSDITDPILNSILYNNMLEKLTGVWSNINNTYAYNSPTITNFTYNLIDPTKSIANFDINGTMQFTNKILKNCININTINFNNTYPSGSSTRVFYNNNFIKVCSISYNNVDYFKLKIYSYEKFADNNNSLYSMQEITIYGLFNNSSPIYYDNFSDNTNIIQRIIGIYYVYNTNVVPNTITFYIQINPLLGIQTRQPTNINNYIYVDFINTYNLSNLSSLVNVFKPVIANITGLNDITNYYLSGTDFNNLNNLTNLNNFCILNSDRIIDSNNRNILKYKTSVYADNFILKEEPFNNNNNVLINDSKGIITASTVSSSLLQGLSNISLSYNYNKIPFINSSGILDVTNATNNQINALNTISTSINNLIPYINQGLLTTNNSISINKLNTLNTASANSFIITGSDGNLTSLNLPLTAQTIGSTLTLFKMSNPSNFNNVYTNANISIGSTINPDNSSILYVNGTINITSNIKLNNSGVISWNEKLNLLQVNNSNISDDVLKNIVMYPLIDYDYYYNNIPLYFSILPSYVSGYYIGSKDITKYSNKNPYTITLYYFDDIFQYPVYKIIDNNFTNNIEPTILWKTPTNFDNNGLPFSDNIRYVDFNNNKNNPNNPNTACGTYFTFQLPADINIILVSYVLSSKYVNFNNTINSFNVFGYNTNTKKYDLVDSQTNIIDWNINGNEKIFNVNRTIPYNKFAFCITKTNNKTNSRNYVSLYSFRLCGISTNGTYIDTNTNIINTNNNQITFNNNIGIKNYNPAAKLSIGPDLFNSPLESSLNINDGSNINLYGSRLLNLTRPSPDSNNIIGVRASHIINNWGPLATSANTRYDINLTHTNFNNENLLISMLSDGKIGLNGLSPDLSINNNYLSLYSNIYLYNTASKYISIGIGNITNNYSIILPETKGIVNNFLTINSIDNNVRCAWTDITKIFDILPYCKIGGDINSYSCNVIYPDGTRNNVSFQIDGKCIIANNTYNKSGGIGSISSDYISKNSLIVIGNIYTTQDITTDSDISYKYNLEKILKPIEKIKQLNGYTFNRNDTEEGDTNRYCGLIAQEVQKIMPEAIITKHDGKLRVVYNTLAGLYVEGIKELNEMIEFQNFKINILIVYNIILLCFLTIWHPF